MTATTKFLSLSAAGFLTMLAACSTPGRSADPLASIQIERKQSVSSVSCPVYVKVFNHMRGAAWDGVSVHLAFRDARNTAVGDIYFMPMRYTETGHGIGAPLMYKHLDVKTSWASQFFTLATTRQVKAKCASVTVWSGQKSSKSFPRSLSNARSNTKRYHMKNDIYDLAISELSKIFGAYEELESRNGARFKSAKKGKLTVYHADIESGNKVEIAFEIDSIAKRLGMTPHAVTSLIADMRVASGRGVVINPRFNWPRVGLTSHELA